MAKRKATRTKRSSTKFEVGNGESSARLVVFNRIHKGKEEKTNTGRKVMKGF